MVRKLPRLPSQAGPYDRRAHQRPGIAGGLSRLPFRRADRRARGLSRDPPGDARPPDGADPESEPDQLQAYAKFDITEDGKVYLTTSELERQLFSQIKPIEINLKTAE